MPDPIRTTFASAVCPLLGIVAVLLFAPLRPVTAQPVITSLQPQSGTPDEAVRIYGAGFSSTAANDTVSFGGVDAPIDSAKGTVIYAKVPTNVPTGLVSVTVSTAEGSDTATDKFMALTDDQGAGDFDELDAGLDSVGIASSSVGDINGDGNTDFVVTGSNTSQSPTTTVYLGDGSGGFSKADASLKGLDNGSTSLGDVNNDGNLDLVVTGVDASNTSNTIIYLGDGSGAFSTAGQDLPGVRDGSTSMGDVDGDGDLDLLVTGNDGAASATLYLGDGSGGFSPANANLFGVRRSASSIGDVNGDDHLDLLITGFDGSTQSATLYLGDGTGAFPSIVETLTGVERGSTSMADMNGDGNLDLLITGFDGSIGTSTLYIGDGSGGFSRANAGLMGMTDGGSSIGDVNGDGSPDLLVTGADTSDRFRSILYLGDGTGSLSNANAGLTGVVGSTASLGDIDSDGDLDVLLAGENLFRSALLYENKEIPPEIAVAPSSLSDTLAFGNTSTQSVEIDNLAGSGAGVLDYSINFVTSTAPSASIQSSAKSHSGSPPITIEDPVGHVDSSDVDHIKTQVANDQINISVDHASIDPAVYALRMFFDVDQDPSTGVTPTTPSAPHEIGAEYSVRIDLKNNDVAQLLDGSKIVAELPISIDGSTIHFAVPLSAIEGQPPINTMAITGTSTGPKDFIPDKSNATIPPQGMNLPPTPGSLPPGEKQSADVGFSAETLHPGQYNGTIQFISDDPTQDTAEVPVSLTVDPPPVSFTNPSDPPSPGADASVKVDLPSSFTPDSATVFYRKAGDRALRDTTRDLSDVGAGGSFSFSIPGTLVTKAGVQYFVHFEGVMTNGSAPLRFTTPKNAPHQTEFMPVDHGTATAKGVWQSEQYRMLTIPVGLGDRSVFDVLETQYGSYDSSVWRLARWASDDDSYRFGPQVGPLRPGHAAWLVTRSDERLAINNAQSADASGPKRIRLKSGWNQIGTPFSFPITWADVQRPESVRQPVVYDASQPEGEQFQFDTSTLQPWDGAFVYNEADSTVSIRVPPVRASASSGGTNSKSGAPLAEAEDSYRVQPVATLYRNNHRLRDPTTVVGFSQAAEKGFGPKDRAKPPAVDPHLRLHVTPREGPALARSLKPPTSDGAAWDLRLQLHANEGINTPEEATIVLNEHGSRPANFQRYVLDLNDEKRRPITNNSVTVPLSEDEPTRRLRLILGTEAFAKEHSKGAPLSIQETALQDNAPNPFSESTTISYQLANDTRVQLSIYDILGRRVQTLVDESQRSGVHNVDWAPNQSSGRPLASGVYFCRMETESYSGTRKLVLIR